MPFLLHQVSYTPEALSRLLANPQDRFDAVRSPIEKLGGRVLNSYFAFGQHDAVLITEMPDSCPMPKGWKPCAKQQAAATSRFKPPRVLRPCRARKRCCRQNRNLLTIRLSKR